MLACHASQRDWLREHHGMDEYIESMKQHCGVRGRELSMAYAEAIAAAHWARLFTVRHSSELFGDS